MLQSMGLQRVGHNLVAVQQQPLENVYPHKKIAADALVIALGCYHFWENPPSTQVQTLPEGFFWTLVYSA